MSELPRLLYLSADPSGRLDLDAEQSILEQFDDEFVDLKNRKMTTPQRIFEFIRNSTPDILHISCHVETETLTIPLPGGRIELDALCELISLACKGRPQIRLLVFAACHGEHVLDALTDSADIVVGFAERVQDKAARASIHALYPRLFSDDMSVAAALDAVRTLTNCSHDAGALVMAATAPGVDLDQVFFGRVTTWAHSIPRNDVLAQLRAHYDPVAVRRRAEGRGTESDEALMLESMDFNYVEHPIPTGVPPLVCRVDNLEAERFWPDREFGIQLLGGGVSLELGEQGPIVDIDLHDQKLGIYSNAGKKFLARRFPLSGTPAVERAQTLHESMRAGRKRSGRLLWAFEEPTHRLRWASGGYLPVIRWRGRRWIALFFRDRDPIGWNIANGASNDALERRRPSVLAVREAKEELVVLDQKPEFHMVAQRHVLNFGEVDEFDHDAEQLLGQHDRIRAEHDDLVLTRSEIALPVTPIPGRTTVRVHDRIDGHVQEFTTPGVYVSINPVELGIEVTAVGEIVLPDEATLLDGETRIDRGFNQHELIRRPVALFDLDDIAGLLRPVAGQPLPHLGTPIPGGERRLLQASPRVHVFGFDIEARRRACKVRRLGSEYPQKWLEKWGRAFDEAIEQERLPSELLTLCPATWRAIELAVADIVRLR